MILAGVVHHEIEANGDAPGVAVFRQIRQILHGPQLRLNLPEVADRIAAVTPPFRAFQQGHQMEIADTAVRDIIQLLTHPFQGTRKSIDIHQHPDQAVPLIPVRMFLPVAVDRL